MLVLAAIVPHGDEILIPEDEESAKLHNAMIELGERIKEKKVDEYIFVSPHHLRIDTHLAIMLTEYLEGSWKYKNLRFRRKIKCNKGLAWEIYEKTRKSLPVVGVNFGALEGELSKICLDWGTLIPLYFLPKRKMVLMTPGREIPYESLIYFGKVVGEIVKNSKKRIGVIISADHAHAHRKEGPYGYHPDADYYDKYIMENLENLDMLLKLKEKTIENAKPDSFWQLLILLGILKENPLKLKKKLYGLPTYFGMAVAWYERVPRAGIEPATFRSSV